MLINIPVPHAENEVPVSEHLFMTDVVAQCLDESVRKLATPRTHDFAGIEKRRHTTRPATSDMPSAVPDHSFFGLLWADSSNGTRYRTC